MKTRAILLLSLIIPLWVSSGCRADTDPLPDDFDLQGHRGAMGLKPENTIPGFLKAMDLGVTTIEFDLAVSRDLKAVISHEPWFRSDICLQPDGSRIRKFRERSYRIFEYDYEKIAQFDCGSLRHPDHPEQKTLSAPKPLMKDAILEMEAHARGQDRQPVRYNIELKTHKAWDESLTPAPDGFAKIVYDELQSLSDSLGNDLMDRVNIQSFDPRPLHAMREIDAGVPIAILTYKRGTVDDHLAYFDGLEPEIYSPNYGLLTPSHVERAHELGMTVLPWTVNTEADMKTMVSMGVDGLITDYPDRFISLYPDFAD